MADTPTKSALAEVEFISAEEYEAETSVATSNTQELEVPDWEATMEALSTPTARLSVPRNSDFSRKEVVTAFNSAFELIGGVPRLALWAHSNQSDFYKLYARLLPSQASQALGESNELVVRHVLPRGALDE